MGINKSHDQLVKLLRETASLVLGRILDLCNKIHYFLYFKVSVLIYFDKLWPFHTVPSTKKLKCLALLMFTQGKLDKQLYRVDRKCSMADKKLQEQREKERQNKVNAVCA